MFEDQIEFIVDQYLQGTGPVSCPPDTVSCRDVSVESI